MKTTDSTVELTESVITELRRHKRAIAQEHGDDIVTLLRDLRERQAKDSRVISSIQGEQIARANRR